MILLLLFFGNEWVNRLVHSTTLSGYGPITNARAPPSGPSVAHSRHEIRNHSNDDDDDDDDDDLFLLLLLLLLLLTALGSFVHRRNSWEGDDAGIAIAIPSGIGSQCSNDDDEDEEDDVA
jgi:hypothetical protein